MLYKKNCNKAITRLENFYSGGGKGSICAQMKMEEYGNKCSFWGTIGTQTTLPFGSSADVESVCRAMLDSRKGKGGLVLAPTHLVEPEVPLENVEALVRTAQSYNTIRTDGNYNYGKPATA